MSTFFVTGGAGFIGSNVVRELLKDNHKVVVYDNFIQYISPLETRYQENLHHRFKDIRDQVIWIRGDTRDKIALRDALYEHTPSHIIHLAALPLADFAYSHTEEAMGSILAGTTNILDVIKGSNFFKRLLYVSSSMVYGDFQYTPADCDHPKNPRELYGGLKLAGEIIVSSYGKRLGVDYTIVRPSAVYGPTDVNRRVTQIFVERALRGEVLELHGGGQTALDFSYVKDTAHGIVLAATKPEGKNETFNITAGQGRTLKEFVEILSKYVPNVKIIERPADPHRPNRGSLDISKAKKLLGYEPLYPLERGIPEYVTFVQAQLKLKL